uniref:Thrombopoietin n=1 Tax=Astyanax mexicanus TaxID=7994 RepID=A0A3B1IQ99_ASTMX
MYRGQHDLGHSIVELYWSCCSLNGPQERAPWESCAENMVMAVRRLLLLCVVFSEVQSRPVDFVCSAEARSTLNIITELEKAMESCSSSDRLPLPIRLPIIRVHRATWDKTALQQKRASVCSSLRVLMLAISSAKSKSILDCQTSILQRLEHNVQNHLRIIKNLKIQGEAACEDDVRTGRPTDSLTQTLKLYGQLLRGPLELLLLEFSHTCPA